MTEPYAVKHVADRVANEPRDVGVIAAAGRGADSRSPRASSASIWTGRRCADRFPEFPRTSTWPG